jgi:integrase
MGLLTQNGRISNLKPSSKMKLTLPPETKKALEAWIGVRGAAPGPLFLSMNRTHPGKGRLTAIGLYGMVRELGRRLGFKVWPHGLRHAAITEALDLTGATSGPCNGSPAIGTSGFWSAMTTTGRTWAARSPSKSLLQCQASTWRPE